MLKRFDVILVKQATSRRSQLRRATEVKNEEAHDGAADEKKDTKGEIYEVGTGLES